MKVSATPTCPHDSVVTFVVLESGTCQIPVVTSHERHKASPRNADDDDDYMTDIYSYPLHEADHHGYGGETMNMRVDIKMKVSPNGGSVAPPSTPAHSATNSGKSPVNIRTRHRDTMESNSNQTRKSFSRNRSAPPLVSQYRCRLSTTSQWIKKRALAELTRDRSQARRPRTSVRPFSERQIIHESPQLSKIIIEPTEAKQATMPDMGSFKGKPPISISKRPVSFKRFKASLSGHSKEQIEASAGTNTAGKIQSDNKVEQYVSELRKSIKLRKPGLTSSGGRKKMSPFAVWAISNCDGPATVSPDLEKLETEAAEGARVSLAAKVPEVHAVRSEVIKQIAIPETTKKSGRLEVKGSTPPGTAVTLENHARPLPDMPAPKFARSKPRLSSAAKRATQRYSRQFEIKSDIQPFRPRLTHRNILQQSGCPVPSFVHNSDNTRILPYLKLRQPVTDYQTYKQNSAPFVRTLI